MKAGLLTWNSLINSMAGVMQGHDPLNAQIMKQCVRDGELTKAVEYFFLTSKMLSGDKLEFLRNSFKSYNSENISSIAKLPFRACVTTNFDKSIHDAIAKQRGVSAIDYKYGDASFKQAQWEEDLFVARIHGAAEVPTSIILSESQFKSVMADENYLQLLRSCFIHRNVLFLGFSFYDPAIRSIFEDLDRQFGPAVPGRHMALLPEGLSDEFFQKASRLNIELVRYDSSDDHRILWDAIENFELDKTKSSFTEGHPRPLGPAKNFLAACFARSRAKNATQALKESLVEGIVSALLQETAPKAISKATLLEKIRTQLGLNSRASKGIVDTALRSLTEERLCRKMKSGDSIVFAWQGDKLDEGSLDAAIGKLTASLSDRALIQQQWRFSDSLTENIPSIFIHMVRTRGWDLGAAFAAGRPPEPFQVKSIINESQFPISTYDRDRLLSLFLTMLQYPSEEESQILGELGRVSFALEMAFQAPKSTLLHNAVLPHRIYFDASVLLPAVVEGHPFSRAYQESIARLKKATLSATIDLKLVVSSVYLNEVISHRRKAEAYEREYGKGFEKIAQMDALYHGPSNTNVYIGGYASWIKENGVITFEEYLRRFAPYTSEHSLRKWLVDKGYEVVDSVKTSKYAEIYAALEKEYSASLAHGKTALLIEHDALQLTRLELEMEHGDRVLFVTADRQLRQMVSKIGLSNVAEGMVSNVGLVQFIELILGGVSENAGVTELLWSTKVSDKTAAMRSYFTSVALATYDDGMALAMSELVDEYADSSIKELKRQEMNLDVEEPRKRARAFQALGTLEAKYLNGMREAVEKLRKRLDEQ